MDVMTPQFRIRLIDILTSQKRNRIRTAMNFYMDIMMNSVLVPPATIIVIWKMKTEIKYP
jgi:hypothetical protein